jgi:hypothetical protein
MCEVDERVLKRKLLFWELLQPDDYAIFRRVLVVSLLNERSSRLLVLLVLEDSAEVWVLWTSLYEDRVPSIEKLLGGSWCERGSVLEFN